MNDDKCSLVNFIIRYFLLAFISLSLGFCIGQSFVDILNLIYIKYQMHNLFEFNYMNVRESFPVYFAIATQILGLSVYSYQVFLKSSNKLVLNIFKNPEKYFWIFIILILGETIFYLKDILPLNFEKYYLIFGYDRLVIPYLFVSLYNQLKSYQLKNWFNLNRVIVKDFCKFWFGYCMVNLLPIFLFWFYLDNTDLDEGGFGIFGALAFGLSSMILLQFLGLLLYSLILYINHQNLYTEKLLNNNFTVSKIWIVLILIDIIIYNLSGTITKQILHNMIICLNLWGVGRFIFPLAIINLYILLRKKFYRIK